MNYYLTFILFLSSGHVTTGQAGPYKGKLACEAAAGQMMALQGVHDLRRVVTICTAARVQPLTWNGKRMEPQR